MEATKKTKAVVPAKPGGRGRTNVMLMTQMALLTAIIILMAYTPLGYLRAGAVEITFIVVPVAVGAVLLGPGAGAFLGLVFGLTSFAQCFGMSPLGTLLFSAKPFATAFCCIVPRVLVGLIPALLYQGMAKLCKKRVVNIAVSCVLAPISNTVLYLGCMLIFFQDYLIEAYQYTGKGGFAFVGWLFALVALNAVLEAASCLLIGSAVCNALWNITRRQR